MLKPWRIRNPGGRIKTEIMPPTVKGCQRLCPVCNSRIERGSYALRFHLDSTRQRDMHFNCAKEVAMGMLHLMEESSSLPG